MKKQDDYIKITISYNGDNDQVKKFYYIKLNKLYTEVIDSENELGENQPIEKLTQHCEGYCIRDEEVHKISGHIDRNMDYSLYHFELVEHGKSAEIVYARVDNGEILDAKHGLLKNKYIYDTRDAEIVLEKVAEKDTAYMQTFFRENEQEYKHSEHNGRYDTVLNIQEKKFSQLKEFFTRKTIPALKLNEGEIEI